ncbi:hypothetical protein BV22DRAFT_1052795, partial [Leucogyrophana mollusca]
MDRNPEGNKEGQATSVSCIDPAISTSDGQDVGSSPCMSHAASSPSQPYLRLGMPAFPVLSMVPSASGQPPNAKIPHLPRKAPVPLLLRPLQLDPPSLLTPPETTRPEGIPKSITDKLAEHDEKLAEQTRRTDELEKALASSTKDLEKAQRTINELHETLAENEAAIGAAVHTFKQDVGALADALENLQLAGPPDPSIPPTAVKKEEVSRAAIGRDNVWNTGCRNAFLQALNVTVPNQIKALHPRKDGKLIVDDTIFPDFAENFEANAAWHGAMITYLRANVRKCQVGITQESVDGKTKKEMLDRVRHSFNYYAAEYRKANGLNAKTGEQKVTHEQVDVRRTARKRQKARLRSEVREDAGLKDVVWNFLFEWQYQSTDESQ